MRRSDCESLTVHRGHGRQQRGEGTLPAAVSFEQIQRDLQGCAIQHAHRALIDGKEVARLAAR